MVTQDTHGLGGDIIAGIVGATRALLDVRDDRAHVGRVEDRRYVLQDHGQPLDAHAGIDVLLGQRGEHTLLIAAVLHEDQVVVLEIAVTVTARLADGRIGAAILECGATIDVNLGAGAAGASWAGLPEIVLAEGNDTRGWQALGEPQVARLGVEPKAHRWVTLVNRDPERVDIDAELVDQELPREVDGAGLEVVAKREVTEHLEEGAVPGGQADLVDVRGAEALLHRCQSRRWRLIDLQEVGLELLHAGRGQQHRRVVARRHERRARNDLVAARRVEVQKG